MAYKNAQGHNEEEQFEACALLMYDNLQSLKALLKGTKTGGVSSERNMN